MTSSEEECTELSSEEVLNTKLDALQMFTLGHLQSLKKSHQALGTTLEKHLEITEHLKKELAAQESRLAAVEEGIRNLKEEVGALKTPSAPETPLPQPSAPGTPVPQPSTPETPGPQMTVHGTQNFRKSSSKRRVSPGPGYPFKKQQDKTDLLEKLEPYLPKWLHSREKMTENQIAFFYYMMDKMQIKGNTGPSVFAVCNSWQHSSNILTGLWDNV